MLPQFMIIGDLERAETRELRDWISQAIPAECVRHFSSLAAGLQLLAESTWIPDVILIVQSLPDEFRRSEMNQLGQFAPLARWIVAYGSWCESDGRTRDIWPLAVRVPLRSAVARFEREWQGLSDQRIYPLPMSASREEAFAIDHPPLISTSTAAAVVVCSPDGEYRRYLAELMTSAGMLVIEESSTVGGSSACTGKPLTILFDIDPWGAARYSALCHLQSRYPGQKIVGVMHLPSPAETAALLGLGLAAVLPKLGDQQRILDAVRQVDGANSPSQGESLRR